MSKKQEKKFIRLYSLLQQALKLATELHEEETDMPTVFELGEIKNLLDEAVNKCQG